MSATEHLQADAMDVHKYGTIARCTVERCPDFAVAKGSYAFAIIGRAGQPVKPQHAAKKMPQIVSLRKHENVSASPLVALLQSTHNASAAKSTHRSMNA